jgi:hypothetical protein
MLAIPRYASPARFAGLGCSPHSARSRQQLTAGCNQPPTARTNEASLVRPLGFGSAHRSDGKSGRRGLSVCVGHMHECAAWSQGVGHRIPWPCSDHPKHQCIQGLHMQPERLGNGSPVLGMASWHFDIPTIHDRQATHPEHGSCRCWILPVSAVVIRLGDWPSQSLACMAARCHQVAPTCRANRSTSMGAIACRNSFLDAR